ncbi:MAG: NAD(+)/NADH kinase [Chthonomonadales bacterium]|nr:NAD(+)/NADH kinase [Chthonomonadales bacterium]
MNHVAIVASRSRPSVAEHARNAAQWLHERSIAATVVATNELDARSDDVREADLIVTLGGDGTILAASRFAAPFGIPILGIHMGRFGFIAEAHPDVLIERLADAIAGKADVEERTMVQGEVRRSGEAVHRAFGLNDIVISKGAMTRMLHLTIQFGDGPVMDCVADGVIVATPTGSTAYALSAGGPIMDPTIRALLVVAICPHTLAARPVVVPDTQTVAVQVGTDGGEVKFSADSASVFGLQAGDEVHVRKYEHSVRLVTFGGGTFYDKVHDRLLWGERVNA